MEEKRSIKETAPSEAKTPVSGNKTQLAEKNNEPTVKRARNESPRGEKSSIAKEDRAEEFSVFHANMGGFTTHAIDVEAQIALLEREPDVVLLNETKLDEGNLLPTLTGYVLICRRDRKSENKGSGIAVFAKAFFFFYLFDEDDHRFATTAKRQF